MLQMVTVCRPAKAFIFYSGHPDVCTAIIIIIIMIIIIIIITIIIIIIIIILDRAFYGVSQKFVPLLFKSVIQCDWT